MLKLSKYKNAGVREYWIIDETSQKIYIYSNLNEQDNFVINTYNFTDTIPVSIYDDLYIDMKEIF